MKKFTLEGIISKEFFMNNYCQKGFIFKEHFLKGFFGEISLRGFILQRFFMKGLIHEGNNFEGIISYH